jgi:glycoprotein endo-alpha-1,2-mannosidase
VTGVAAARALVMVLAVVVGAAACGAPGTSPSPSLTPAAAGSPAAGSPAAGSAAAATPTQASTLSPVSPSVTAFYYPWYGSLAHDGAWRHWNQLGHKPAADIASSFYPQRGAYSSRDPAVLAAQMADLRSARIGVIAVSWWGQGTWDDSSLDAVFVAAASAGIKIAFHMEPYQGQTAASIASDIRYLLGRYGTSAALQRVSRPTSGSPSTAARPLFYLFASSRLLRADLKATIAGLRGTVYDSIVMVHSPNAISATRVGADGVYTYDALASPDAFATLVSDCRTANLICSPSVAPGFDNSNAVATGLLFVDRASGGRYDAMWQAAISARAEWISVTSYNEWHEGTQIEPATASAIGTRTYAGYDGAYGSALADSPSAYLVRTAYWIDHFQPGG